VSAGRPVMGVGMAVPRSVESRTVWARVGGVRGRLRGGFWQVAEECVSGFQFSACVYPCGDQGKPEKLKS